MKKNYKIYCYTCLITEKKYIGQTCLSLEKRAGRDGRGYTNYDSLFEKAIKKYGWENFQPEILEDGLTLEEANEREKYWISRFNTLDSDFGYNLQTGGKNCEQSAETRQKLSAALKGRKLSEEQRRKLSEARKGYHMPAETRKKLSDQRKGKQLPDDWRNHVIEALKGHSVSEMTRKKLSESNRGKKRSFETRKKLKEKTKKTPVSQYSAEGEFIQEYESAKDASIKTGISQGSISNACHKMGLKAGGYYWVFSNQSFNLEQVELEISKRKEEYLSKLSEANKGKHLSEEARRKLREANLGKHYSEETIEKLRKSHLGKKQSEQTIKKRSESLKGRIVTSETRKKLSESSLNNPLKGCIPIQQFTKDGKLVSQSHSISEAKRQTGIDGKSISNCCKNKPRYKSAGGFIWKFKNNFSILSSQEIK